MRGMLLLFVILISFDGIARDEVRKAPVEIYHYNSGGYIVQRENHYDNGYWGIGVPGSVFIVPTSGYYFTHCSQFRACNITGYCWVQQHCN